MQGSRRIIEVELDLGRYELRRFGRRVKLFSITIACKIAPNCRSPKKRQETI